MNRVAVFARFPIPGQVKTRLSPALPVALSAELYAAMLLDAVGVMLAGSADRVEVFWAEGRDEAPGPHRPPADESPGFALPPGLATRRQRGKDLGERLAAAFEELLADPADRAVVVGADCPELGETTIHSAFAALDQSDLVVGPAQDGGYYLIGLRRPAPTLFSGVAWGTDRVLAETLARADRAGLRVGRLDTLGDIDTPEDLVRFVARRSVSPPGLAPRTEAALRDMGLLPARVR